MLRPSFAVVLFLLFTTVKPQVEVETTASKASEDIPTRELPVEKKFLMSSSVDENGGVSFMILGDKNEYLIEINCAIITKNMTQILEVTGLYEFGSIAVVFKGNEIDGFSTKPSMEPQISSTVIKTILGK